jgi:hypothetical protein
LIFKRLKALVMVDSFDHHLRMGLPGRASLRVKQVGCDWASLVSILSLDCFALFLGAQKPNLPIPFDILGRQVPFSIGFLFLDQLMV